MFARSNIFLAALMVGASLATISLPAWASGGTDVGVFVGVKNADFSSTESTNPSFTSSTGIAAGVIATGDMAAALQFRTGAYYSERAAKMSIGSSSANIKFTYIDIPVTALYRFNDMLGVFGGAVLGLKVASNCSGDSAVCNDSAADNVNSGTLGAQLGVNVKFHPNWSAEAMYDLGLSDASKNTKVNALGASLIFTY